MTRLITRILGTSIGVFATLAWSSPSFADDPSPSTSQVPADTTPATASAPANSAASSNSAVVSSGAVVAHAGPQRLPKEGGRSHVRLGASLLLTGIVTFGLSYGPAAYVASDAKLLADRKLQVPFAGPWLDLASRPACGMSGVNCGNESGYTALLLMDSFFQALSAVEVFAGLVELAQEEPTYKPPKVEEASVRIAPTPFGAGSYGLSAIGKF
jgi:hypothetical protein